MSLMSPWSVYILLCQDGSFYTGISNNVTRRFLDHKNGNGGAYTRSHPPLKIIYIEPVSNKSSALKRELEIKSWSRQKKIKMLNLSSFIS